MTQFKPFLQVNRLLILKSGRAVYDQVFHNGVNIIRGKNSSGKSTIADFIFYALGGDLTRWKLEAESCDYTLIEVNLSNKIFTLKRQVGDKARHGMDILEGSLEAATQANVFGWLRYPYLATENKESFYQAILKELGIPYSKSDNNNSITLHQLLRLMYVDQMTSLDRLFKFDRFDSPSKRQAIGELLIGLSDFELYEYRVRFQKVDAILDTKIREIKILHEFFGEEVKTVDKVDEEIDKKNEYIAELEKQLYAEGNTNIDTDAQQLNNLRLAVSKTRADLRLLNEEKTSTVFEISDSQKFVLSLQERILAINDSSKMIHALSDIGFYYCPACFTEVKHELQGCCLCGISTKSDLSQNDPTFKIRKEIEFQISESNYLIDKKQERLLELELRLNQTNTFLNSKVRELSSLEKPIKQVNQQTRSLLLRIGSINKEIDQLNEAKSKFAKLRGLYLYRDELQKEVNQLRDEIELREGKLDKELSRKKKDLSALTLKILNADKDHEEIFHEGKRVDFNFGEDKVSIDDRILFSASSMVYLKNAFRLALFQASCLDPTYLYPRFLLMDNVEDKGMEPQRSHLFQSEILRVSVEIQVPHQIIYTTSMINPNFDGSEYCVGEKYDDHNKTLKI